MTAAWCSGVILRFPGSNAALRLGDPPAAAPTIELRRSGSFWRLPAVVPPGDDVAGVLVRPRIRPEEATTHAVLDAELWLLETHTQTLPGVSWDPPSAGPLVRGKTAGAGWFTVGGARLVVGVLPQHLLDRPSLGSTGGAAAAEVAIDELRQMVADLIDRAGLLGASASDPARAPQEAAPGVAGGIGPGELRQSVLRLHRLHGLLREGGVLDAWDAMIADPAVRIVVAHPTRGLPLARSPVWSGPRGPWAVAGGWSPAQPLGQVHDRVVTRSTDTPPNRLAVQLASRVRAILDQLRGELTGSGDGPYHHVLEELHRRTVAVERAPAFAEVSRTAPLALDSPELLANRRARPLLLAWARLDRDTEVRLEVPVDEILIEPLKRTHDLYELWCTARLRQLLDAALGPPTSGRYHGNWLVWSYISHAGAVQLGVSMAAFVPDQSDPDGGFRPSGPDAPLRSWGLPSQPDGFVTLSPRGAAPVLVLWDAKYRRITYSQYLSGAMYQAHAFRDCVSWKEDGSRALWSVILHPTKSSQAAVPEAYLLVENGEVGRPPCRDTDGTLSIDGLADMLVAAKGGVGILSARPHDLSAVGPDPLAKFVSELLRALLPS
jgi:hypothetical protein